VGLSLFRIKKSKIRDINIYIPDTVVISLTENPKESKQLVDQLKEINDERKN